MLYDGLEIRQTTQLRRLVIEECVASPRLELAMTCTNYSGIGGADLAVNPVRPDSVRHPRSFEDQFGKAMVTRQE
jgi:hypothetical protein